MNISLKEITIVVVISQIAFLAMVGHDTAILSAMIQFAVFIIVTSIIYHLGFRKYLIKKLGLTKREGLELKQNQK